MTEPMTSKLYLL